LSTGRQQAAMPGATIVHHAAGLSPIGDGLGMHIPAGLLESKDLLDVESFLRSYNTKAEDEKIGERPSAGIRIRRTAMSSSGPPDALACSWL
jgi:hypothetical protein